MLRELLGVLQQQHENGHAMKLEWIVIWLIIVSSGDSPPWDIPIYIPLPRLISLIEWQSSHSIGLLAIYLSHNPTKGYCVSFDWSPSFILSILLLLHTSSHSLHQTHHSYSSILLINQLSNWLISWSIYHAINRRLSKWLRPIIWSCLLFECIEIDPFHTGIALKWTWPIDGSQPFTDVRFRGICMCRLLSP